MRFRRNALVFISFLTIGLFYQPELSAKYFRFTTMDTIICYNELGVKITFETDLVHPVYLKYSYDGGVATRSFSSDYVPFESGTYQLIAAWDKVNNDTVYLNNETLRVSDHYFGVKLSGGGAFCGYLVTDPIVCTFTGIPPYSLHYEVNGASRIPIVTDSQTQILSDQPNTRVTLRQMTDKYCRTLISDSAKITSIPLPDPTISGPEKSCVGATASYSAHKSASYKYTWNVNSDGNHVITEMDYMLWITYTNTGSAQILCEVIDTNTGCENISKIHTTTTFTPPTAGSDIDTLLCFDLGYTNEIDVRTDDSFDYFWPETGSVTSKSKILAPGTYSYIITDTNTCSDTGYVNVEDGCKSKLFVPEAFTPNGDNINDELLIFGEFVTIQLFIYDIQGEQVYFMNSRNAPWNGKSNGRDLPAGPYYWRAIYTDAGGREFQQNGTVTLIR